MRSYTVSDNLVWGFIPARGGSKSIPLKNLTTLGGRPLIEYAIKAAHASATISRTICSTDSDKIKDFCLEHAIDVQKRPSELAGDNVSTVDVIIFFLQSIHREEGMIAEMIALLEPTSPFLLPSHIDDCATKLRENKTADSIQTITSPPPNHHAYNQRIMDSGLVKFRFKEERAKQYNKQLKSEFFIHGNLRIFRSLSVLKKRDIFGDRSLAFNIPYTYAFDADGPEDFKLAECLLSCELVKLPHM